MDTATGEDGTTLVELLVAFAILMILIGGLAATLIQSVRVTREARWREIAANVATAEVENLRAIGPGAIASGTVVEDRTTSAGTVTVERTTEWIPADAAADACQAPTDAPRDLLRVTVLVSWPGIDNRSPTRTQTIITPAVGSFDLDRGHVAVRVLDRDGRTPAARPLVRLTGGPLNVQESQLASTDGCAFFDHLEPGDYTAIVMASDVVDDQGNEDLERDLAVQAAATTPVQFTYDRPASLEVALTHLGGGVPAGIDLTLRNTGLLPDGFRIVPGDGDLRTIAPLFPYASGYEVWPSVGGCAATDPAAVGGERVLADTPPDGLSSVAVPLATVRLRAVNPAGNTVVGAPLSGLLEPDDGCPDGAELAIGPSGADDVVVAVPLGSWTFHAPGRGGPGSGPVVLADPTTVVDVEVVVGNG